MVASIEGWIVQVMVKVPAVGKVMVLLSPGLNMMPLDDANSLGAPAIALNVPWDPVTRL